MCAIRTGAGNFRNSATWLQDLVVAAVDFCNFQNKMIGTVSVSIIFRLSSNDYRKQAPVVRRPISANRGLSFNLGFFFFCSKELSRIIFFILLRATNHQFVGKRIKLNLPFKLSYLNSNFVLTPVILTLLWTTRPRKLKRKGERKASFITISLPYLMLELSLSVINEVLSATPWLTYLKFICVSFQGASTCRHVKGDALCLLAPKRTACHVENQRLPTCPQPVKRLNHNMWMWPSNCLCSSYGSIRFKCRYYIFVIERTVNLDFLYLLWMRTFPGPF